MDPRKPFRPGRFAVRIVAALLFAYACVMPCIDTRFSDAVGGFDVRGIQCLLGIFIVPIVAPLWTPLWLALAAGNIALIAIIAGAGPNRTLRALMTTGFIAALLFTVIHLRTGVPRLHPGHYVWVGALALGTIAAWLRHTELPRENPTRR